jgi:hypothetical protein
VADCRLALLIGRLWIDSSINPQSALVTQSTIGTRQPIHNLSITNKPIGNLTILNEPIRNLQSAIRNPDVYFKNGFF